MLSGKLWPAHPRPYPDELLSSWLVRIAHANGLKVQTFCHMVFDQHYEVWNRDIDRLAPEWLMQTLSQKTGIGQQKLHDTTLLSFKGKLYDQHRTSGQLPWITTLQIYHRKRRGHGLQFCPLCLAEDKEPYFRKSWRLALHTFCPEHMVLMHDRCPMCGEGVTFYRQELGKPDELDFKPLSICWHCQFDLAKTTSIQIDTWDETVFEEWRDLLLLCSEPRFRIDRSIRDKLKILHHFIKVLTSPRLALKLHHYLCTKTGQPLKELQTQIRSWESRNITERHHVIGLCWWLLDDYPNRLFEAWQNKIVRYNHMLKDFSNCPQRFYKLTYALNRKTNKNLYKNQY